MNILFIHASNIVQDASSGIIRVSALLGAIFQRHGHQCYNAYYKESPGEPVFPQREKLVPETELQQLERICQEWDVDVIISQLHPTPEANRLLTNVRRACRGRKMPLVVSCYHNCPYIEIRGYNLRHLLFLALHSGLPLLQRIKKCLWGVACMMVPDRLNSMVARKYQRTIDLSDRFVLLSDKFMPRMQEYQHLRPGQLCYANNPETYSPHFTEENLSQKEKRILVIARMDEYQKRLSYALDIWQELEHDPRFLDWSLDVVGMGPQREYYEHMVEEKHLRRVTFYGNQNPIPFYQRASLMMMTSAYEGWGMTLIEAQSMGVVPVVFNSYESLTDIVTDRRDGFIVPSWDTRAFLHRMRQLMTDPSLLRTMQLHALSNTGRFSEEVIYEQWQKIISAQTF